MKAVILSGGFGSRIAEESQFKPKPMIEIGEKPIIWHIMKLYSHYGINDFIICAGYKQHIIKEWFSNYFLYTSDVIFDFTSDNKIEILDKRAEKWKVAVIDTGLNTMTGGRIKRIEKYVGNEAFYLTYGDTVSDVDIGKLTEFHNSHGKCVTLTSTSLAQQKGVLEIAEDNTVISLREKEDCDSAVINGGFMVCNPEIFKYIEGDSTILEQEPMHKLAADGELKSYYHPGFWQCMDTQRERERLERFWNEGTAPWKIWKD